MSKVYAEKLLKRSYPLTPGDYVPFGIADALMKLNYAGETLTTDEVNKFIKGVIYGKRTVPARK